MVDKGENYLYDLNLKVRLETLGTKTHCVFCSVTNQKKMEAVFQEYRPDMVFHAAAHKHVPLMEENVDEAIHNNIFGTRTCAELSERFGVERFVLVSTDKVVNPTSIMGMTKNICEKSCSSNLPAKTRVSLPFGLETSSAVTAAWYACSRARLKMAGR